jgi:predicted enzyme involved in methoxymalonyl-ACP biosynthesis
MRAFDRFGDYGLVAVMLGVASDTDAAQIRVDTWLMSCRVIGRTFEQYMFGEFVKRSITLGYTRLLGEYIPTQKNSLVEKLFTDVGCERLEPENPGESSLWYALDLLTAELPATSVLAAEKVAANHGS